MKWLAAEAPLTPSRQSWPELPADPRPAGIPLEVPFVYRLAVCGYADLSRIYAAADIADGVVVAVRPGAVVIASREQVAVMLFHPLLLAHHPFTYCRAVPPQYLDLDVVEAAEVLLQSLLRFAQP